MARLALDNPSLYLNPELSQLQFNGRVLQEAQDARNPLLERVKFLSITASNLDEFFEVRVAGLLQRIEDGQGEYGPDGLSAEELRDRIAEQTHEFNDAQYHCWNQQLQPALREQGVGVLKLEELKGAGTDFISSYCAREIDPLLTPVTVDPSHPFPHVINKSLCVALLMRRKRGKNSPPYMGVITVPRALPRLVKLPSGGADYILLSDLVTTHAESMYRGFQITSAAAFRVTRNSNLYVQEEETRNLLESVRTELHNRRKGDVVRLEIEADADPEIIERLRVNFALEDWQVYRTDGPVNLSRLMALYAQIHKPELKFRPFIPREMNLKKSGADTFEEIRSRDILLHHPFDSYDPVVKLIETAAEDPNVVSIKQTLYRTNEESPIAQALIEAAATKEISVVVELKARFDEASNIRWARNLEDAGVQVFHGVVGLKTHCKLALIIRRDPDGVIRRYAHLGTGNYNPETARYYTDLSLFTANEEMTHAVHQVFSFLTAYAEQKNYRPLMVSPQDFAARSLAMIAREAEHARAGRKAGITAKMNALTDKNIIEALYRASQAGVKIDLIVRGMCALRPGIKNVSENIKVRSIVGRLLEHSRIYCFENGGEEEIYSGSADWMPRNLYDRVEVIFPLTAENQRKRIRQEILDAYMKDVAKTRILRPDGSYVRAETLQTLKPKRGAKGAATPQLFNAQEYLISLAEGKAGSPQSGPIAASLTKRARRAAVRKKKAIPAKKVSAKVVGKAE